MDWKTFNMTIVEYILLTLLFFLGITTSFSDIKNGTIPNKLIAGFAMSGIILDIVYYTFFASDIVLIFGANVLINTVIALCLYYTHMLAGGDCKLIPVLSMLYPAGMYLSYGSNNITLFAAICFAVFFGYIYLLVVAIWKLLIGDTKINRIYVINAIKSYIKTYLIASLLVMSINLIVTVIDQTVFKTNVMTVWLLCIIAAWVGGKHPFFRKKVVLVIIIIVNIGLSVFLKLIPISLNPRTYLFTAILLMCQITIQTNIYEQIRTSQIKKGMILSTFSSMMMQNSKIEGLPGISTEDLRNRLTEAEAESVRRWGKSSRGMKEVSIVKKIPFAIFLLLGYACYFVIWRAVR